MRIFSIFILCISIIFLGHRLQTNAADIKTLSPLTSAAKPLFSSSVVSNDIDFIKFTDASMAHCIAFQKTGSAEIAEAAQKTISFERIIFCRALCRWNQGWARAQLHWLIQNMWPVAYPIYQAPCAKLCLM